MGLVEAVADTLCTTGVGIIYFNRMKITYQRHALQRDPIKERWKMDGEEEWFEAVKEMGSEIEPTKERGREAGRRKEVRVGPTNGA